MPSYDQLSFVAGRGGATVTRRLQSGGHAEDAIDTTRREFTRGALLALSGAGLARPAVAVDVIPRAAKPMRILILGGTGFIGPHQVAYAIARGHKLTLFNRGRQPNAWPNEVEELIGDRDTGELGALAGHEWDVCIDNPTTLPFWVRDAGQVLRGKVGQYIFVSTISVYASNATPGDESASLATYAGKDPMIETAESLRGHMADLYGPLKVASEREAQTQFPGATTIVRPGLIAGPGDQTDRFTYWPVRLARGGEVLAPGDGSDPVQLIDVRDLAEWTIRLAETHTTGVFNATGPASSLTMGGMLRGVERATGPDATLTWVSTDFLETNKVAAWSDLPVWVPARGETAGFHRRSIGRALHAGLTFRPLGATAEDTLAWFRQQPADRQAKLRAGLAADREARLLAAWKGPH